MSKSILVIDTPERCSMCEFLKSTDEGYCYCGRLGFDYQVNEYMRSTPKGKPDWCPLREVPQRKFYNECEISSFTHDNKVCFIDGYNTAINEILGDENE